jgi:hypothetical protein
MCHVSSDLTSPALAVPPPVFRCAMEDLYAVMVRHLPKPIGLSAAGAPSRMSTRQREGRQQLTAAGSICFRRFPRCGNLLVLLFSAIESELWFTLYLMGAFTTTTPTRSVSNILPPVDPRDL